MATKQSLHDRLTSLERRLLPDTSRIIIQIPGQPLSAADQTAVASGSYSRIEQVRFIAIPSWVSEARNRDEYVCFSDATDEWISHGRLLAPLLERQRQESGSR